MAEHEVEFVRMPGGVEIAIPASIEKLTSYVLREQGDWFEVELDFCRRVLQPGERVIDIGANHGVYALTAAARVGATGKVWAFEPSSVVAELLERSRDKNSFSQLTVVRSALSGHMGVAQLHVGDNSELSSLARVDGLHLEVETVPVTTLDQSARELGFGDIAFVKLDAEGEEQNIVSAARETLGQSSPLIMFERKRGAEVNDIGLVEALTRLGYQIGRLVPGLDLIVPFSPEAPVDPYQLNLFAFKADRAEVLERRGFLVRQPVPVAPDPDTTPGRNWLGRHAYARSLTRQWSTCRQSHVGWESNELAISEWVRAHDATRPPTERLARFDNAVELALRALNTKPLPTRMLTAARLAFEFGERASGVKLLQLCLDPSSAWGSSVPLDEPFLPPCPRFDAMDPAGKVEAFCIASVLEAFEQQRAFSSYFTGTSAFAPLSQLERLGFLSGPMANRLDVLRRRHPSLASSASLPL